jgi:hypothetical protein
MYLARSIFINLKIQTTRNSRPKRARKCLLAIAPNFTAVHNPTIGEELKPLPLVIGFSSPMRA